MRSFRERERLSALDRPLSAPRERDRSPPLGMSQRERSPPRGDLSSSLNRLAVGAGVGLNSGMRSSSHFYRSDVGMGALGSSHHHGGLGLGLGGAPPTLGPTVSGVGYSSFHDSRQREEPFGKLYNVNVGNKGLTREDKYYNCENTNAYEKNFEAGLMAPRDSFKERPRDPRDRDKERRRELGKERPIDRERERDRERKPYGSAFQDRSPSIDPRDNAIPRSPSMFSTAEGYNEPRGAPLREQKTERSPVSSHFTSDLGGGYDQRPPFRPGTDLRDSLEGTRERERERDRARSPLPRSPSQTLSSSDGFVERDRERERDRAQKLRSPPPGTFGMDNYIMREQIQRERYF